MKTPRRHGDTEMGKLPNPKLQIPNKLPARISKLPAICLRNLEFGMSSPPCLWGK